MSVLDLINVLQRAEDLASSIIRDLMKEDDELPFKKIALIAELGEALNKAGVYLVMNMEKLDDH